MRDYTVSVYAADAVTLVDEQGNRGENTKKRSLVDEEDSRSDKNYDDSEDSY